ncbi:MAG: asparagine--tRNA ligase [Deltaproteobacteria bacterium]|nr:asparagine--tRNA ligase [Deltaproteobacteria bacterium]
MSTAGTQRRISIRTLLEQATAGAPVEATGWVKTARFSKNVSFVHLFDGSTTKTVQVVLTAEQAAELKDQLGIGAALRVRGSWVASPGGEQDHEIGATEVIVVGTSDPATYPLQKKRTSLEHLRTIAHLRPRTNTFQSLFRVRNALSWQIHRFYQERGFQWVHTPILATMDAEGAGELFSVQAGDAPEGFFGKPAFLAVSGQLEVESFAQAFTDVYTFGPTFRAENSNTARHASEFWMIEPEMAFADLNDVIALAEEFIKEITRGTLAQCPEDFAFFDKFIEKGLLDKIQAVLDAPFARVTWHDAQEHLVRADRQWEHPVGPGTSLQAEHERYLAEEVFKGPVFITDYPGDQKAFYMRLNDDGETVAATDLIVPRLGEIIGGSQREERLEVLLQRMAHHGMSEAPYWWYTDLRRFGSTPHGGFGLGFERMLLWLTGMKNIRDAIPFPRTPGSADF